MLVAGLRERVSRVVVGSATVDLVDARRQLQAQRHAPPSPANLDVAIDALDKLLGRMITAKQQLDTKAALIIPAIGVIGGIVANRASPTPSVDALAVGGLAMLAAALAVLYALGAVLAANHDGGPGAVNTALATSVADEAAFKQAIADALAIAVLDTIRLVSTKAARFNRAVGCTAAGVILLLVFIALGGLTPTAPT